MRSGYLYPAQSNGKREADYVALRYGARFEQYLNRLQTMDLDRVSSRIGPLWFIVDGVIF